MIEAVNNNEVTQPGRGVAFAGKREQMRELLLPRQGGIVLHAQCFEACRHELAVQIVVETVRLSAPLTLRGTRYKGEIAQYMDVCLVAQFALQKR